ncbi:MAG: hypothetical protein ACHQT9_03375 [Candidatus Saccharimonadales bacterium]
MSSNVPRERNYPVGEGYDIGRSVWLNMEPEPGAPELADREIPVPTESPFVALMRDSPDGPHIIAPDSTDWVPPDIFATSDPTRAGDTLERRYAELETEGLSPDSLAVPKTQREFLLSTGDPASIKLLEVIEHGIGIESPQA